MVAHENRALQILRTAIHSKAGMVKVLLKAVQVDGLEQAQPEGEGVKTCGTCGETVTGKRKSANKIVYCSRRCSAARYDQDFLSKVIELAKLKMGLKASAKRLGCSHTKVRRYRKIVGMIGEVIGARTEAKSGSRRKPINWIAVYHREWMREVRPLKRFDEDRHWSLHPEVYRWRGARTARSQYKLAKEQKRPYWIASKIRTRIYSVLKGHKKSKPTEKLLGCTFAEFKAHLESQFTKRMTWDNYGKYWHIDHIVPCSVHDVRNQQELARCFHYSNMRPLTAKENWRRDKWPKESQAMLL